MPDVGGVTTPMDPASSAAAASGAAAAAAAVEETRRLALEDRLRTRDALRQEALEAKRLASQFNADAETIAADIADAASTTSVSVVVEDKLLPAHLERVGEAIQKLTKY